MLHDNNVMLHDNPWQLPKDPMKTARWYRRSQACVEQDMSEPTRQKVADWLRGRPDLA